MRVWQITDHIAAIDHGLLGGPGIGATYVVQGDSVALVETGTLLTVPDTLAGLEALGVRREAVSHILCTHMHMDHAGGAGQLALELPRAQVIIHSTAAPHLIDPSKLLPGTRRAVGEVLWQYKGTIIPLAPERLLPAEELRLDLGRDVVLEAVATPGHSPDHTSYLERSSGSLFTGDAIGANFTSFGVVLPVTVPPQFDLEAQWATFERLRALRPDRYLVTHFGEVSDTDAMWIYLREKIEECAATVEQAVARGEEPDSIALQQQLLPAPGGLPAEVTTVIEVWGKMTFDGLLRYFKKRQQ